MPLTVVNRRKKLALKGELTIYAAKETAETLLPRLRAGEGAATLDLGEVTEIDSAGLQLLLAARRTATRAQRDFELAAVSPAVREALDLVQCDELRGCIRSGS